MSKLLRTAALGLAAVMAASALASCSGKNEPSTSPAPTEAPVEAQTDAPQGTDDHDHDHDDHDHEEMDMTQSIGRVGTVEFTLGEYAAIYETYAPYAMYIPNIEETIHEQLVDIGVQLTRCEELGIEFDAEDEKLMESEIEEQLEYLLEQMTIDSSITGEEAIREAQLNALKELMAEYGYTYDSYFDEMRENYRNSRLMEKLYDHVCSEVEFGEEQAREYFDEQLALDKEAYENSPEDFSSVFGAYIMKQGRIPFYTPNGMFTVKHLLVQFENYAEVSETVPGVFGDEQNRLLEEVRSALESGISLADFTENYVLNKDRNSDTGMLPSESDDPAYYNGYSEHGYIMHEALVPNYFTGFGEAACVLYHGEDWVPEGSDEGPIGKYGIKFYTTTDGHRIAEVQTNTAGGGIHFIFINKQLEGGEAKLDYGNENDPVYASILEYGKAELEETHYTECLEQWRNETTVELNDELIQQYIDSVSAVG